MNVSSSTARRRVAWIAVGIAAVALLLLAVIAAGVSQGLDHLEALPVHVVVNGNEVPHDFGLSSLSHVEKLAIGLAIGLALLVAVPIAIVVALVAALFGVLFGFGVPVLVLVLVALVLLSPLIALGALLVWALRRDPPARPATIAPR